LKIKGKLTLKANSTIYVSGLGYNHECNSAQKGNDGKPMGGGGGHCKTGGDAGFGINGFGGKSYKDEALSFDNTKFGSAGGNGYPMMGKTIAYGGNGGGILSIECDELIMEKNSSIKVNGMDGELKLLCSAGGGGSGGTILINTNKINLHPTAKIEAKGGNGQGTTKGKSGDGSPGLIQICLPKSEENNRKNNCNFNPTPIISHK